MNESVDVPISADHLPTYAHPGDAGCDLRASEDAVLAPGERVSVGTGVAMALPEGYVGFVVPRSGLAFRHGISIVNAPGTIDAGYRGEIRVALLNTDRSAEYRVTAGDRIAQLVVLPVVRASFVPVDVLPDSARGAGGFGSTGYGSPTPADDAAGTPSPDAAAPAAAVSERGNA